MHQYPYEFRKLIACWQALPRSDGQAPLKTSFSPARVASLIPSLFLVERLFSGELVVRLKGNDLNCSAGRDTRECCMLDAITQADWGFYEGFIRACGAHVCGGRLQRTLTMPDGYERDVEVLHVPLADAEGEPRFMLGVLTVQSDTAPAVESAATPKEAILNYQYVDLGLGVPASNAGVAAKSARSKINKLSSRQMPPAIGEYEPAYIN